MWLRRIGWGLLLAALLAPAGCGWHKNHCQPSSSSCPCGGTGAPLLPATPVPAGPAPSFSSPVVGHVGGAGCCP